MLKKIAVLLGAGLFCSLPYAADIYRWVDEQGRTQFADKVPDKYKKSAVKVESRFYEPTEQQRREGAERAAADKSRATGQKAGAKAPESKEAAKSPAAKVAASPAAKAPVDDCATQQKAYRESQECFAPYRQVNGSIRAEGYQRCTEVRDPSPSCGIPGRN